MLKGLMRGAAAGAAGTTALNAITYLDVASRPNQPREWDAAAWLSDAVQHLAFGLVASGVLRVMSRA